MSSFVATKRLSTLPQRAVAVTGGGGQLVHRSLVPRSHVTRLVDMRDMEREEIEIHRLIDMRDKERERRDTKRVGRGRWSSSSRI